MIDPVGPALIIAVLLSAALSAFGTWMIRPTLMRVAMAKPNARSSHIVPTPQGAGIAVIFATLSVASVILAATTQSSIPPALFGAALLLTGAGAFDDIRPIPVVTRLAVQAVCAGTALYAGYSDLRIVPLLPLWIEQALLFVAILWFVNLVNFMDGLDLITVAEVVPVALTLAILGALGFLSPVATLIAAALSGAALGFAPFNRPVARIFLGDAGSLPIGLLLAWCLIDLAARESLIAALLLPLYYLADATVTLLRRLVRREAIWTAHRSHFYQRATDNGFRVAAVVSRIFALNVLLAGLGVGAAITTSTSVRVTLLVLGIVAVASTMRRFATLR